MTSLFVDNLTVVDCSYLHPEWGMEGESWIAGLVLMGALDPQSMVMDFGLVKKQIKAVIDATADHALLVPMQSKHLTLYEKHSDRVILNWCDAANRMWHYECPPEAVCEVEAEAINAQSVQQLLRRNIAKIVPHNVEQIELSLHPESIDGAFYHYSHGLKKHDGNCQRMVHGHRSRIEIWQDGRRALELEAAWAAKWKHIYLGSAEDMTSRSRERIGFAYTAPQGPFALELPAECCDLLEVDSTVECIADHIAASLKAAHPDSVFRVKAFEGVGKGAFGIRD